MKTFRREREREKLYISYIIQYIFSFIIIIIITITIVHLVPEGHGGMEEPDEPEADEEYRVLLHQFVPVALGKGGKVLQEKKQRGTALSGSMSFNFSYFNIQSTPLITLIILSCQFLQLYLYKYPANFIQSPHPHLNPTPNTSALD